MKKIFWALVLLGAWFAHGRLVFAEDRLVQWLGQHEGQIWSGDSKACEAYTDNVEVSIRSDEREGDWEVEGGKEELCGYYHKASAAFALLDASTHTEFSEVSVQRKGFPWTEAKLSYVARVTLQMPRLPDKHIVSHDQLTLVRTLQGLKIKSIESQSVQR
ncbi:hypothetical protein RQP53_22085 [Paucibacter sp. APW11]|uniref:Lipocalin-like domain-containing protein n=1 Tax=Roseateles aquae TaxID=3077235 RepID=A0ABU3PHI3_9BURK|nr:hypothetical protein [Paucibacter sp. APW11]MDT9001983.1 hypothetical protein [Paucibacter sp. APW11]